MKLIVISSPLTIPEEPEIINTLFEKGLEIFHVHKPSLSKEEVKKFIHRISPRYHSKIYVHSDFPKFHSLGEVESYKSKHEYAFLSPVFDSISKSGYKSKFDLSELESFLKKIKNSEEQKRSRFIALGGIDESRIETCRAIGFMGVAVLGAVWKSNNPTEKFLRLKTLCQKRDLAY